MNDFVGYYLLRAKSEKKQWNILTSLGKELNKGVELISHLLYSYGMFTTSVQNIHKNSWVS